MSRGWVRRMIPPLVSCVVVFALLLSSSPAIAQPQVRAAAPAIGQETDQSAETATPPATEPPTETPTPEPATSTPTPASTEPPPTSAPPTATPVVTATESIPLSPAPEPTRTATPAPTAAPPTPTDDSFQAAATVRLTIVTVDLVGALIGGACFNVHRDAGSGVPGTLVRSDVCDWQPGDGRFEVDLEPGSYVLVETRRPFGFGKANDKPVAISGSRTVTVKHQPLTTMVITSTDSLTGLSVADGCFSLEPITEIVPPPVELRTCDFDRDGITIIEGVDRGTYRLVEDHAPFRYLPVSSREVTVSTLSSPRAVSITHTKGASISIHKRNEAGEPITGACFQVLANDNGAPGDQVGQTICDTAGGPADGELEGVAYRTGEYFLRESWTPAGYLPVADQPLSLTAGQETELTIVDPLGGRVEVSVVDEIGNPIPDVCPAVYTRQGNGARGEQVDLPDCDLGTDSQDGRSAVIGLESGSYLLVQSVVQPPGVSFGGYVPAADVPFDITAGETIPIDLVNPRGGALIVTTVAEQAPETKVNRACYRVYRDAGGGERGVEVLGFRCEGHDEPIDGVLTLVGFPAGSYVLAQANAPVPYNLADDVPFTIGLGETKSVTVANPPYGTVRIFKKTPVGDALPGACFQADWNPDSPYPRHDIGGVICDNADGANDGTVQIALPDGNFILYERTAPTGYALAGKVSVELRDGGTTDVTITDPVPSTLTYRFANVWGDTVSGFCIHIGGTNVEVYDGRWSKSACDVDDGMKDGRVTFTGLTWGTWTLSWVESPGKYIVPETVVELDPGESKTVDVVLGEAPPVITVGPRIESVSQTSVTIYWETDQKAISSVAYGTGAELENTVPESPGVPTRIHRVTITGLTADTSYGVQARPLSPNGDVQSETIGFRTLSTTATGRVIASTVESDGSALPGACYALYRDAGSGVPGRFVRSSCDWADQDGNNGRVIINGLTAGSYVLVQAYAAKGFKLARPIPFTVTDGQTKRLTITNTRGGYLVRATSREFNGPTIENTCFTIYRNPGNGEVGDFVVDLCDGLDGVDGVTTFSGIAPGDYYLWQRTEVPGYIRDPIKKFTIKADQATRTIVFYSRGLTDPENIVMRAIDSSGALVPGACFLLVRGESVLGETFGDRCDGDDGSLDGLTYFTKAPMGSYTALEYMAPRGYVAGKVTTFTKSDPSRLLTKRVTQVPGGETVKVTSFKGSSTSKLPGACYGVYRLLQNAYVLVSYACDDWDGANDGVTRIVGIGSGTYRLYPMFTPAGYREPAYVTFTVGTTTKGVNVRVYPG